MSDDYVLEIVEISEGEIVLRTRHDHNTLLTLKFSSDALDYLDNRYLDVAKVMLNAGMQAATGFDEAGASLFIGRRLH
ncbi:MAG: hypothetical protein B0D91_10125 [Oceanospirillales bacterium LUC14_002_19_P2]|nr:MAG: hypothetical protein B0D91_10125 [Oceanospirillales bacterium LUC14_002_19_P2]